jgi:hypothetical protein
MVLVSCGHGISPSSDSPNPLSSQIPGRPKGLLDGSPPWLTSAGPLLEAGTPLAKELSKRVPEGAAAWYFYFSDLNAFAYCSAKHGAFEWLN